ncbi:MAG: hypothetical protein HY352_02055 [Candidatus Omnitrophica bacterium]|nr:hypothetical protein [Candidatus Omnitrophota bacterium]
MRKLTWINWLELLLGALPATLFFGPATVLLLIGVVPHVWGDVDAIGIVLLGIGALACMAALWMVILAGPAWIKQRPVIRWAVIVAGIVGIGFTSFMLMLTVRRPSDLHIVVILGGPIVVGLRYLPSLLRRE